MSFTPRRFAKPSLMEWEGNKISDHNRSELSISVERIEEAKRMANATMRKFIIADKRTFAVSWDDLPQLAKFTVDGFWGKREMETFYYNNPGAFTLTLHHGDGVVENIEVMMSKFESTISKRGAYDFWTVSVEMVEV